MVRLGEFIEKGELSRLEEQGLIKAFEYTFELAWNVIKDFYEFQGVTDIQGSRDSIRLAFNRGLITGGESWMEMIKSRVKTSHTYNEETAREISEAIFEVYYDLFLELEQKMNSLLSDKAQG